MKRREKIERNRHVREVVQHIGASNIIYIPYHLYHLYHQKTTTNMPDNNQPRAPSPDPHISTPNNHDVFWWELKSPLFSGVISSKSQWKDISERFGYHKIVVSLAGCQVSVDNRTRDLFHNKTIIDKGSWARVNATLRHLYVSSLKEGATMPFAIKLGTLTWNSRTGFRSGQRVTVGSGSVT
ncbi:hypothetical protein B0F90DRAFT_1919445 [Multifurca ochricompacta]|uniref:Uncharacterized protein n=1 Tax=Multifurca ochricompacta TaxID=376703 RepID=A0AAD4QKW3_9AGAM|nr:hypothetical protein B0F90DRAFT_1919445 [Multifurca ochricompacta]